MTEYITSAIATTSLREMLRVLNNDNGCQILRIDAQNVQDKCPKDEYNSESTLGITSFNGTRSKFVMSYNNQKIDGRTGLQHNQMTESMANKILDIMDNLGVHDVPISRMTIAINSEKITDALVKLYGFKGLINRKHRYYTADFVSEKCNGVLDEDKLKKNSYTKELIEKHRFKKHTLNMKRLKIKRTPIIITDDNGCMGFPEKIGECRISQSTSLYHLSSLMRKMYGKEYGMTKQFKMDSQNILMLIKVS